jgi:hypothetical protein
MLQSSSDRAWRSRDCTGGPDERFPLAFLRVIWPSLSRAIGLNILPIGAAQPPGTAYGHCSTIATLCAPPQMPAITKQAGAECDDDVRVRPRAIDRKRSEPDWCDAGAPT